MEELPDDPRERDGDWRIGGLVSKKKAKVDIRHREGTKNEEELRLELTLGGLTGVTEWERIGKSPGGKDGFTVEKYGSCGVAKARGCIGISARWKVLSQMYALRSVVSDIQLGIWRDMNCTEYNIDWRGFNSK